MGTFKIACPSCSQELEADDAWDGMELPCPRCKNKLTVRKESPLPQLRIADETPVVIPNTEDNLSERNQEEEPSIIIRVMSLVVIVFFFLFFIGLVTFFLDFFVTESYQTLWGGRVANTFPILIVIGAGAVFQNTFGTNPVYLLFGLRSVEYQDAAGKKQKRLILKHPVMRPIGTTVFILTCIYILYCVFYSCRF